MILRAGVIGAGYWGSKVASEYVTLMKERIVESVSICDVDSRRLKPFDGVCETFTDSGEILKQVDLVHVCTPNFTHYEIARKALGMHVNVLVEKPMADSVNQAYDLVELSMREGAILQVGHIFRFANVVRRIKLLSEEGEFGKRYYFVLEWAHLIRPIENVDVMHDLLPHPLDIINFITGKWPLSFNGVGKPIRRKRLAEAAFVEAIYDDFFANIHLSWVVPTRRRKLEIVGSGKSITADCVKQTATLYENGTAKDLVIDQNNTIRDEVLNFLNSIRTGKSDYNSSIVGARTVEMMEAATRSTKILGEEL